MSESRSTTVSGMGIAIGGVAALFLCIYLGAFWLLSPTATEPAEPPPGTGEALFGLVFVAALLVVTAGMLLAFKFGFEWVIRYLILGVSGVISFLVLFELLPGLLGDQGRFVGALLIAAVLVGAVYRYPEWWVIDIVGVTVGMGAVLLFGLTFGLRTVLILLISLAIYDFISVYKTKHMISLAEGALAYRLPVVLFVPTTRGFTLAEQPNPSPDDGMEGVIVIGLGDAIIPGMLVTAAVVSGPGDILTVSGFVFTIPAIGALAGILLGLVALFVGTARDRAHPGLPFLSSGAIIGYVLASVAIGIDPLTALTLEVGKIQTGLP